MKLKLIALVVAAFLILWAALVLAKVSPVDAGKALFQGSLGSASALSGTLKETTPLLLAGLAVFVALRAGLFNIGVEGQLLVGALSCAVIALKIPGPGGMILGLLAGILAGMVWALPAGWIRAYRNGHEVITTIMLNSVAIFLTTYLAANQFKAPAQQEPATATLVDSSQLPFLVNQPDLKLNWALVVGLIAVSAVGVWLRNYVSGYRFQAVGANAYAARMAGVDAKATLLKAMLISGAIAGLAGGLQVVAYEHRFYEGFSPGYGFDALGVALLAGTRPWGLIPASFLFGVLTQGGVALQIHGVPKGITTVILGLLILIAAAIRFRTVKVLA